MSIWEGLTELIFPSVCLLCGQLNSELVCHHCYQELLQNNPYCERCGKPTRQPVVECRDCRGKKLMYKGARCLSRYEGPVKDLIQSFKYKHKKGLSHLFAQLLLESYPDFLSQAEVVTFVPMPPLKLLERGYNQSFLLARELAKLLEKPLIAALQFNFWPTEQNKLSLRKRKANVKGAFKVNLKSIDNLSSRHVLLVDDVYTTGFTIQECSQVLNAAGVEDVLVVTVARTILV